MALIKCTECGHEISTEAKTCPNCGARNKAYKSKIGKLIFVLGLGFIIYIIYLFDTVDDYLLNCDTTEKRKSFAKVIDNSSHSQINKLRVIDITEIRTIKSGDSITDMVCDATINFNSIGKQRYRFTWRESESGSLLIHASPKK